MVTMEQQQQRGSAAKVETAEVLTGIKSLSLFGAYDSGYVCACGEASCDAWECPVARWARAGRSTGGV